MSLSFRRIHPVPLFETTWKAEDLTGLKDTPGVGDVEREVALPPSSPSFFFGPIGRSKTVPRDIWGVDWTPVPAEDWETDVPESVFDFETIYMQLRLTVAGGIPGDSILFGMNDPTQDPDAGIHAFTHLQIPSFGGDEDSTKQRATAVSRHLLDGFSYARSTDDPQATIQSDTLVALYGVGKTDVITITGQAVLLGGIPMNA